MKSRETPSRAAEPRRRAMSSLDAALIQAMMFGLEGAVETFLSQGANPNAADDEGTPVLHLAFSHQSDFDDIEAIVRLLVAAGASPRAPQGPGPSLPERIIRMFSPAAAERFLGLTSSLGFSVDAPDPRGRTALMWATEASHDNNELIEILLRLGADPAKEDDHGVSAYARAQKMGRQAALIKMAVTQERGALERVVADADAPSKKRGPL